MSTAPIASTAPISSATSRATGIEVVAVDDPRQVVAGADVICCATNAMKPVFDGDWLEDGQIVVSIANSDVTNKRSEVDRRTFERATASSSTIGKAWSRTSRPSCSI